MGDPMVVEVKGLDEFTRRHKKELPDAMKDLRKLHRKVSNVVLPKARANMPTSTKKGGAPPAAHSLKMSYKTQAFPDYAAIRSGLPYAGISEFGGSLPKRGGKGGKLTRARQRRGKADDTYMERVSTSRRFLHKPKASSVGKKSYYVYPAVDEATEQIKGFYMDELHAIYEKYRIEF
jgi:hypothetical protein